MTEPTVETLDTWGIVELMGHKVLAGHLTERTIAGAAFLHIRVPDGNGGWKTSKLFGAQAIYCITPTDEATATAMAAKSDAAPVNKWTMQGLLPAGDVQEVDEVPY